MLSFLFKPKWQHRDETVRANAVAQLRDAELFKALPALATDDPSEAVRSAALERLNDRSLLLRAALEDHSETLRLRLRKRLLKDLLAASDGTEFEPLLAVADAETIERIAVEARAVTLRRKALQKVERAGLLADRALADNDPEIRVWLADRLPEGPSLERVLEGARTRDKRLYKRIRERLDSSRKSAGSPALIEAEALALCQRLEQLLRTVPGDAELQAEAAQASWNAFGEAAPAHLLTRFSGTLQTLRRAIEDIRNPRPPAVSEPAPLEAAATPSAAPAAEEPDPTPAAELQQLLEQASSASADEGTLSQLKTRWASSWATLAHTPANQQLRKLFEQQVQQLREQLALQSQQHQERQAGFRQVLEQFAQALDAGHLQAARSAESQLGSLLDAHRELQQGADGKRLAALRQRLAKLGQWQRWSSNEARMQLCADMEALPGLGLHPDALSAKVKELQQRFSKLDQLDGLSAEQAREQGLARRFRALSHAALKPARGFFEKRAEVRQRHSEDIARQISEVEALLDSQGTDIATLLQHKRSLGDAFRELDRTDPARRSDLAKQMKALLERISSTMDNRFAGVKAEKEKLIAQLRLKIRHAPREEAIEAIKSTQQRFKMAGRGQRASDQALWEELKSVADPVFAAQKVEREAQDQAAAEQVQQRQQLIAAVHALAQESLLHPGAAGQGLSELDQQWRGLSENAGNELEREYNRAVAAVGQAVAQARQQREQERQALLQDKITQLTDIETRQLNGEAVQEQTERQQWEARPRLDDGLEQSLQQRLDQTLGGTVSAEVLDANATRALQLALLIEYLQGRPAPAAYAAQRMEFQVKRLAARMSGSDVDAATARETELEQALQELLLLGPLRPQLREELQARLRDPI